MSADRKRYHPLITAERLRKGAITYSRQSTIEQVKKNKGSTDIQVVDQAALAREYGWSDPLITVIDADLGKSGTSTRNREGWMKMLELISKGGIGAVFVWTISRLSRQLGDFEALRVLCKTFDVLMVIDGKVANPRDRSDTVLLQVQAMFAQHDNELRAGIMAQARERKAKNGVIVSRLPVGWNEDGTELDPEAAPAIRDCIETFRRERTVLATVRALNKEGKFLPARRVGKRRKLHWAKPTAAAVREFLVHPAYAGTYTYGRTECRPELGIQKDGYPARRAVPGDRWVRVPNRLPAYVSVEEQEEFKGILRSNRFDLRHRPRRGSALCQGLVRCAACNASLSVSYPRGGTGRYTCQRNTTTYATKRCIEFLGPPLDTVVEHIFLATLTTPPADMLLTALAEARRSADVHAEHREAQRQRLIYEERVARDRYDECDPRNRLVAAHLEEQLETAMTAVATYDKILAAEPTPVPLGTEKDIDDLCRIAADVPRIWRHPEVTQLDRKQLLRCLIDRIVVWIGDSREFVDATIHWRSGTETRVKILLRAGLHRLVEELHQQGLSVPEIHARLREGDPTTGQAWSLIRASIYGILYRRGLQPNCGRRGRRRRGADGNGNDAR